MKKTIQLESIDPIEIYGVGNKILTEFCTYFPHLKVVARGNELILEGRESDIAEFNIRFAELVERRHHKMNLTVYDVEDLFSGGSSGNERFSLTGDAIIVHGTDGKPIRARNKTQQELVKAYFNHDLIFAIGPAGTGKTYMAIALAVRALKNREIKRIILTRPAVEAGERLGFLPGDLKEKLDPYLQPLYDALSDMIPSRKLQEFMADGTIQIAPLAWTVPVSFWMKPRTPIWASSRCSLPAWGPVPSSLLQVMPPRLTSPAAKTAVSSQASASWKASRESPPSASRTKTSSAIPLSPKS